MSLAIYIDAGHDRNGNPKRGWIISDDEGSFIDFVDEGFQGNDALRVSGYGSVPRTSTAIEVKPSTYRDAYRQSHGGVSKQMTRENKLRRSGLR
jgi:hypothetical protein